MDLPPRELTRNILKCYRAAGPEHIRAGREWYDLAYTECERLVFYTGSTATVTQAVVALAHLSPRITWQKNLDNLRALLSGHPRPAWALTRSWDAALRGVVADDPLSTFGREALKTYYFAKAILGERSAVVVNVWSGRIAGVAEDSVARPKIYNMVADAYRRAARIEQIAPRDLQAATWCAIRGRAN